MIRICVLLCLSITLQIFAADIANPNEAAFIRQWLLLAPLENPDGANDDERVRRAHDFDYINGEAQARPQAGDVIAGKRWRSYKHTGFKSDLMEDIGPIEQVTAYYYAEVPAAETKSVFLSLGSDDTVKAWLNGSLVHSHLDRRSVVADHQLIPVQLKKGINRLLIKVVNNRLGWGLACRFLDPAQFRGFLQDQCTNADLEFNAVFAGNALPTFKLTVPLWMTTAFGDQATVTVDYYDAHYNKVESAGPLGRYGAVVTITPPNDYGAIGKRVRYITLYKGAQWMGRGEQRAMQWRDFPYALPAAYGISGALSTSAKNALAEFAKTSFVSQANNESMAVLLAAVQESTSEENGVTLDVVQRDEAWWRGLRKKMQISEYQCAVQLPADYNPDQTRRWPLLLFLHGSGGRGTTDVKSAHQVIPDALEENAEAAGFILAAPLCYPNRSWSVASLSTLLDQLEQRYQIDPDRIYLTGLSMGGGGSWLLAGAQPERFAAIVPICGWVRDVSKAADMAELPCWIHHGADDRAVTLDNSVRMLEALQEHGSKAILTVFPQTNHENAWLKAYADKRLYTWLAANSRQHPVWPDPSFKTPIEQVVSP